MKQGLISEVQHFCVGDGDGIRTTVFFKGCNLNCKWCHNVECIDPTPQKMRYAVGGKEYVRICGRLVAADELAAEIFEDIKFYEYSGGGVTFSGGEPLLQVDFLAEVMHKVKERGIHTIIDTAGDVVYKAFEKIIEYTDTFFFDIKAADKEDYAAYTGGDFDNITENLRQLIADDYDVIVRIPIIPEHNFSVRYMEDTCELLRDIGVKKVQLLPFNRLGSAKYTALGKTYAYKDTETIGKESLAELLAACDKYFDAKIDG